MLLRPFVRFVHDLGRHVLTTGGGAESNRLDYQLYLIHGDAWNLRNQNTDAAVCGRMAIIAAAAARR